VASVWGKAGRASTATDPAPTEMFEISRRIVAARGPSFWSGGWRRQRSYDYRGDMSLTVTPEASIPGASLGQAAKDAKADKQHGAVFSALVAQAKLAVLWVDRTENRKRKRELRNLRLADDRRGMARTLHHRTLSRT
jgi:hypothetical protein